MTYHFFAIPALEPKAAEDELNAFCRAHRVLGVEHRWVDAGLSSHWAVCVTVIDGVPSRRTTNRRQGANRIDYREVLDPEDFALFAELRSWRKERSSRDAVPVFTLFTNEQLAEIARARPTTAAELGQIEGVGEARLRQFADEVLERVRGYRQGRGTTGFTGMPASANDS